jgi:hypothetical protein
MFASRWFCGKSAKNEIVLFIGYCGNASPLKIHTENENYAGRSCLLHHIYQRTCMGKQDNKQPMEVRTHMHRLFDAPELDRHRSTGWTTRDRAMPPRARVEGSRQQSASFRFAIEVIFCPFLSQTLDDLLSLLGQPL